MKDTENRKEESWRECRGEIDDRKKKMKSNPSCKFCL